MTRSDYDRKHRAERARWAPIVAAGSVLCTRCLRPILVGQSWHLDHDDIDRTRYRGPSHQLCNARAGGRLGNARIVWASVPGAARVVHGQPEAYSELVGKPGLAAILTVDRGTSHILGVKFVNRLKSTPGAPAAGGCSRWAGSATP